MPAPTDFYQRAREAFQSRYPNAQSLRGINANYQSPTQAPTQTAAQRFEQEQQQRALEQQQIAKALESVTPDQYNAVLNDPRFADLFKYGISNPLQQPRPYTQAEIDAMRQMAAASAQGTLGSITNLGIRWDPNIGGIVRGAMTPDQLREQYERQLKDPLTSSQINYKKIFEQPWENAPKKGTAIPEFGGAFFGVPGLSPSAVQKPSGGWRAYQGSVSRTPGAGLVTIGIDPRDPNMAAKAQAWIDYNRARGTGLWQEGAWGKQFGREDAPMPGFAALKKQYPDAPDYAVLDAVIRGMYGQSALPPRSFDFMNIIDPIIEAGLTIASGGNPTLAVMYGAGRGGSENGWLGAFTGGLQGYSMGSLGAGVQAAGGPLQYISQLGTKASNFLSSPFESMGSMASEFADKPWWTKALETAAAAPSDWWSFKDTQKSRNGYAEGGEVSLPPDLAKYADSPHSDIEQLTNMLRRSNLRAEAVPSMSQSVRQRHMAEIGRMEEPSMAARLGVDLGGMLSYEREF